MRVSLYSDLHLEFWREQEIKPEGDVVVLAGDIVPIKLKKGLDSIVDQCEGKPIIYVMGNHEYYGSKLSHLAWLRRYCEKFPNLHILNAESKLIEGVLFIGATMWTDYNDQNPSAMIKAQTCMSDYTAIKGGITPSHLAVRNMVELSYIGSTAKESNHTNIVVTHHAPMYVKHPDYDFDDLSYAYFCTKAEKVLEKESIRAWIHGHTHQAYTQEVYDTEVMCNARGYGQFPEVSNFDITGRTFTV